MASLRTDYKDDVLVGARKYRMVNNPDGTVSFIDVTEYEQEGDTYGAMDVNGQNEAINDLLNPEFTSSDNASIFNSGNLGGQSAYAWEATDKLNSGDSHTTLFAKISKVFKNLRTIAKLIGTTDISSLGGGTITGAIFTLNTGKVGTGDTIAVAHGGTGATTAANARTNLGVAPTDHSSTGTGYGKGNGTHYGHVKLADSEGDSTGSSGIAVTPYALKNKIIANLGSNTVKKLYMITVVGNCVNNSSVTLTFTKFPNGVVYSIPYCAQGGFGAPATVSVKSISNGSVQLFQVNNASADMQVGVLLIGY